MTPNHNTGPYQDISYDDLLLYAVWILSKEKNHFDWHEIVAYSYELFPKRFGLPHYEDKYPDSAQVDKSILRCRDKKCLSGKRGQGYKITGEGFDIVESVQKRLGAVQDDELRKVKSHKKSRAGKVVKHIENSSAYKKYNEGTRELITDFDICSMLYCTLDAAPETKKKNLVRYRQEAEAGDWGEVIQFLDWIVTQFPYIFSSDHKKHKGYYG